MDFRTFYLDANHKAIPQQDQELKAAMSKAQFSNNVVKYVSSLYWVLKAMGYQPVIVNDRYLDFGNAEYQFILKGGETWTFKRIKEYK